MRGSSLGIDGKGKEEGWFVEERISWRKGEKRLRVWGGEYIYREGSESKKEKESGMKSDTRINIYIYIKGEGGRRKGERSKTPPLHPQKRVNTMTSHFSSECSHRHNPAGFSTPFSLRSRTEISKFVTCRSVRTLDLKVGGVTKQTRVLGIDPRIWTGRNWILKQFQSICEYHLASFFLHSFSR